MLPGFYVVRTYSHTDDQQMWKVLSRRFRRRDDADEWKDIVADDPHNKKHKVFVVEITDGGR